MPIKLVLSRHRSVSALFLGAMLLLGCEKKAAEIGEAGDLAEESQATPPTADQYAATSIEKADDGGTTLQLESNEQSATAPIPVVAAAPKVVAASEAERKEDGPIKIEFQEEEKVELNEPECFVEEVYVSADGHVTAFEQLSSEPINIHHHSFKLPTPILARQERFIQISQSDAEAGSLWIDIIDVERTVPNDCLAILPKSFILGCEASQAGVRGSSSCQN